MHSTGLYTASQCLEIIFIYSKGIYSRLPNYIKCVVFGKVITEKLSYENEHLLPRISEIKTSI